MSHQTDCDANHDAAHYHAITIGANGMGETVVEVSVFALPFPRIADVVASL